MAFLMIDVWLYKERVEKESRERERISYEYENKNTY
jgi:hypothetical protein